MNRKSLHEDFCISTSCFIMSLKYTPKSWKVNLNLSMYVKILNFTTFDIANFSFYFPKLVTLQKQSRSLIQEQLLLGEDYSQAKLHGSYFNSCNKGKNKYRFCQGSQSCMNTDHYIDLCK